MKLAVNDSIPAADLLCEGAIQINTFKCPAWPDLVATAGESHRACVPFPLSTRAGIGDAIDHETKASADWRNVNALLAQTGTQQVNPHIANGSSDYPGKSLDTRDPNLIEMLRANAVRDVRAVVERYNN